MNKSRFIFILHQHPRSKLQSSTTTFSSARRGRKSAFSRQKDCLIRQKPKISDLTAWRSTAHKMIDLKPPSPNPKQNQRVQRTRNNKSQNDKQQQAHSQACIYIPLIASFSWMKTARLASSPTQAHPPAHACTLWPATRAHPVTLASPQRRVHIARARGERHRAKLYRHTPPPSS